jgi:hypothetical protein
MTFVPLGMCRAMSTFGALRFIKMNTLEPLRTDNRENLNVDRTLISGASWRTPVRSSILGARKKPWPLVVLLLLVPLVAAAGLFHLLRTMPLGLIQQEFEGFGVAICAAAYGGMLIWRVTRAMAIEQRLQTEPPIENHAPLSPSEPNLSKLWKIQSSLPPEAAAAPAAPVASLRMQTRI